jgi:hypothetical protein
MMCDCRRVCDSRRFWQALLGVCMLFGASFFAGHCAWAQHPLPRHGLPSSAPFDPGLSRLEVTVGTEQTRYTRMAFFVLPRDKVPIVASRDGKTVPFVLSQSVSLSDPVSRYTWTAPAKPGLYRLTLSAETDSVELLLFVLTPIKEVTSGKLENYTIGRYPAVALNGLAIYRQPKGFIRVTRELADVWVSPHYQLGQFLCKQNEGFPKYLILQTALLTKLEMLTKLVNDKGIKTQGFYIMSGYRTPFYNSAIKNKLYSMHQWGGAADVLIDEKPRDGVMDDLNGDGKVNAKDAEWLYALFDKAEEGGRVKEFIGGLGLYGANSSHGPFVHVDARGFKARW